MWERRQGRDGMREGGEAGEGRACTERIAALEIGAEGREGGERREGGMEETGGRDKGAEGGRDKGAEGGRDKGAEGAGAACRLERTGWLEGEGRR